MARADGHSIERAASSFRALAHPTRLRILEELQGQSRLSPSELVSRIERGPSLATVAYHTRELATSGLVEPAGRRAVRGALEHFYRLSPYGREMAELACRLSARAP